MVIRRYFKSLAIHSLLSITCATPFAAPKTPPWPIPQGIQTVEVNGYPMAYQEVGSGTPLVLVHGGFNDYRTWGQQIQIFSDSYRTIAVSLRHHYPEKWNGLGGDLTVDQHASDVAALIKKLQLGKVHLLGHSRGGAVVFTVAKTHPELIRTIILEDGNIGSIIPETRERKNLAAAWEKRAEKARANLEAGNPEKAAQEWWDDYGGPGKWKNFPPHLKPVILANIWSTTDTGERGNISCVDILKFNFPVLLLNGEKSPKHYADIYKELRKCRSDLSEPIVVPKATHLIHKTNPDFFNAAVLDFLLKH